MSFDFFNFSIWNSFRNIPYDPCHELKYAPFSMALFFEGTFCFRKVEYIIPSKIEWDLANRPLSKLLELLDTQVEGSVQWVLLEISWNYLPP